MLFLVFLKIFVNLRAEKSKHIALHMDILFKLFMIFKLIIKTPSVNGKWREEKMLSNFHSDMEFFEVILM